MSLKHNLNSIRKKGCKLLRNVHKTEFMTILAIGAKKEDISLPEPAVFIGTFKTIEDSKEWNNALKSKVPNTDVILCKCELLFTDNGILDSGKYNALLKSADQIKILRTPFKTFRSTIENKLLYDGFVRLTPTKMKFDGKLKVFDVYTSKITPNIDYRDSEIDVPKSLSELADSEEFLDRFVGSVKKLLSWKLETYDKLLNESKEEFTSLQKRIAKMKEMKVDMASPNTIRDMYPNYAPLASFIVDIEELIQETKKKRANVDVSIIKKNLTDIVMNTSHGLDKIIGCNQVKAVLCEILYKFSVNWKSLTKTFNNFCIMGPPGVGKTTIARVIAHVLSKCYILIRGNVKVVSKSDIIAGYMGQTPIKVKALLWASLESVLFIDEAYSIATSTKNTENYNSEAITEIVDFLGKYQGMEILIVAGYKKPMMKEFFPSNEGLPRRIPHLITLKGYSTTETIDMLIKELEDTHETRVCLKTKAVLEETVNELINNYINPLKYHASDIVYLGSCLSDKLMMADIDIGECEFNTKPTIEKGIQDYISKKKIKKKVIMV